MANQFRSPLAAATFERMLNNAGYQQGWNVQSAGTWVKEETTAHVLAIEYAALVGLNLRRHRTQEVTSDMLGAADLIVTMTEEQKEALQFEFIECRSRVFTLSELAGEGVRSINDPVQTGFADASQVWQEIIRMLNRAFDMIVNTAETNALDRTK